MSETHPEVTIEREPFSTTAKNQYVKVLTQAKEVIVRYPTKELPEKEILVLIPKPK